MKIALVIIAAFVSFNAFCQAPKYANEFLSIGVGANNLAFGNASVAATNDVFSTYWNPAGILKIDNDLQLGAMHNEYFAGIAKYDYLGGAGKLSDSSSFGISVIRMGIDDIPNTIDLIDSDGNIDYSRITSFSDAQYAFMFTYARKSKIDGLDYGANLKILHEKVGDFATAWGFGFDAGAQYRLNNWTFSAVGRDVLSTFKAYQYHNSEKLIEVFTATGNEIPQNSIEIALPKLVLGSLRNFVISEKFNAKIEIDAEITFDKKRNTVISSNFASVDPRIGGEISFKNIIYFRAGAMNLQNIPDFEGKNILNVMPTLGLGVKIKNLSIDYALTNIGNQSFALYSNVFSITYSIDKKASVPQN